MLGTALLIGGVGLLAYQLLKPKTNPQVPNQSQYPALVYTGNTYRDTTSKQIIDWAAASGLAIDLIKALIEKMNKSSDDAIENLKNDINETGDVPSYWV